MTTSTRERIIAYLGQGIQQSIVASSCGVTPAYISQLLELEEVRLEVAALQAGKLEEALQHDTDVERVQKLALRAIESKLPFIKSAVEAAKVFGTLDAARRRTAPGGTAGDAVAAQQVVITVPKGASINFKLSSDNQVIEVEGKTMSPLPSSGLAALQKRVSGGTDLPLIEDVAPIATRAPSTPVAEHVLAHRVAAAESDRSRAANLLRDLTTVIDGVQVVL